jgi:hypothetical protein
MISAKDLYRFLEPRLGVIVFLFSRRDDCLRPLNFAGQPTPVLPISEYLAATTEMRISSLRVASLSVDFGEY